MLINCNNKRKHDDVNYYKESFKFNTIKLMIKCRLFPLNMDGFFYLKLEGGGSVI